MRLTSHHISRADLVARGLWPVEDRRDPVVDDEAASDLRLWCEERFGVQMSLVYLRTCSPTQRAKIEAQLKRGLNQGPCIILTNDKRVLSAASNFLTAICLAALALHSQSLINQQAA